MSINYKFFLLIITLALTLSYKSRSQTQPIAGINDIISFIDTLRNRVPVEKLYLQFDKPYYTTGDTLWFKAYLLDAAYLKSSMRSGLLYLELANDTGKVLDRRMISLSYGLGRGNIALNKEDIPEGSYTLRAYTNWMRNFGEDYVFKKNFYIGSPAEQSWLISSAIQHSQNPAESNKASKDSIRLTLQFRLPNNQALGLRPMQLRMMDGKKILFRSQVQTSVDGKIDINFMFPEKADAKNITLVAEDLGKEQGNKKIPIPILINRPENLDLQFMPEGGSLVAGLPARIGFKAIAEDGKGVEVTGKVYSSSSSRESLRDSEEVAVFASLHKGMGSYELRPKVGESYTAKVNLPDGTTQSYPLPAVKSSGTVLRINNTKESDSLEVGVSISPDLLTATATVPKGLLLGATYYLIGQSRGVICYAARITLNSKESLRKIPKSAFPTGIARFTLLTTDRQPLNERIVYIDREDQLRITVNPHKESYGERDSIALAIEVKDKEGNPVRGSFSLAVTDDSQVKSDSMANNILTNFLLTSDLKGDIEEPNYYLQSTSQAGRALDHLLLTQGWVGYDSQNAVQWKDVFNPKTPEYAAEPEFTVQGKVSNVFNKPIERSGVVLLSKKPFLVLDTLTNQEGRFIFKGKGLFPVDTAIFLVQAKNKNNKSYNVGVEVDEFKPPLFKSSTDRLLPWYLNSDTTLLRNISTKIVQQKELGKLPGGNLLAEVVIIGKKIIKDSKNLNGPGEADQTLDQQDLDKAGKVTLGNLLQQRIKGFRAGMFPAGRGPVDQWNQIIPRSIKDAEPPLYGQYKLKVFLVKKMSYFINSKQVRLIIDGIDVDDAYEIQDMTSTTERYEYIKSYLDYYTAADIKGIEVMYNMKYNSRYAANLNVYEQQLLNVTGDDYVYIEVTTYAGKGPFMKTRPGTYIYRPIPFSLPKQFYRPGYAIKSNVSITDLRSIIHWEPNIITDPAGKAFVSFYSADRPGTYTIILEGSDLNGNIGNLTKKLIIK